MRVLTTELIIDIETPISAYHKLCVDRPYSFLFESVEVNGKGGRYSFIGFDPIEVFTFDQNGLKNPLQVLRERMADLQIEGGGAIHFESGFVGYFSYEVMRHFEQVPMPEKLAACDIPEGVFFLPRVVVVFDHLRHKLFLHCLGEFEEDLEKIKQMVLNRLDQPICLSNLNVGVNEDSYLLTPSANEFEAQVVQAKEAILNGEVFQVVLSHSMEMKTNQDPLILYRRLRQSNPSPYLFLMQLDGFSVVGASPETLVKVEKGQVIVKPIAGTRPRGVTLDEDARFQVELMADPKERAEHTMLVDLGRNDVGRVSVGGSVQVRSFMKVERFSSVMHLVSEVTGRVREDMDMFAVFQACFPAGTLSGAPKIRACELIAKLEGRRRGLYGGAVGYFGVDGSMDFAIAIRTMVHKDDCVYVQAGAGVVHDSIPRKEHEECLHKAVSCLSIV